MVTYDRLSCCKDFFSAFWWNFMFFLRVALKSSKPLNTNKHTHTEFRMA